MQQALLYPSILSIFGILLIILFITVLVPQLTGFLAKSGGALTIADFPARYYAAICGQFFRCPQGGDSGLVVALLASLPAWAVGGWLETAWAEPALAGEATNRVLRAMRASGASFFMKGQIGRAHV